LSSGAASRRISDRRAYEDLVADKVRLKATTVARAARALFGTGHAESIVFFFLKAQGATTDRWLRVTSSNTPPPGLVKIAGQPEGFDKLVSANIDKFSGRNELGLPTRPGTRGSDEGYDMFWPIADEPQFLLRKHDANRNAVYSNLTGGRRGAARQGEGPLQA